ncbi:BTAD domain-containing putative transcriptional regulator [Amycolatopsis samaneae]|uniref:BTAD domain-containing putative transcriptional regulator n=1 Tax=Amycolatopsis samaneae TaxID=664691 RepID=A0ABW5GF39_9PSEU
MSMRQAEPFGERLRAARLRAGLSQAELARRAGVSERTLRGVELGTVGRPRGESTRRLAEAAGLRPPEPARGAEQPPGPRISVLGPLAFWHNGNPVEVGALKQRTLLAVLALQPDRAIGRDELAGLLWGEDPPKSAANLLHTYVARLRRILEPDRDAGAVPLIAATRGGYRLRVTGDQLDLPRFDELIGEADRHRAAGNPRAALDAYETALGLWRGALLTNVDSRIRAHPAAVAVLRRRTEATLRYADTARELGRAGAAVARLRALADEEPLHEGLAARLMLALAGDGQQAEALRRFTGIRARLAAELGVDPGADLREAHRRVLAQEVPGPEDGRAGEAPPARPVPRQLPAPPRLFTGRTRELARLGAALDAGADRRGTMVISALGGIGGIGKTWLALHWAHRNAHRFPDGQLYVNLRGFDPTAEPVPPAVAVRGFLDALRVAPEAIPADEQARFALYRSLVAERRMLVVLDNARDAAQAAALLPGGPECVVVVTSRHRLGGLVATHGALLLTLDVWTEGEGRELLTRHLGAGRVAAEPDAVDDLLALCGGLPLALGIVAARVATQPGLPLRALADELRDTAGRLDALDAGEVSANLRAVFTASTHALDEAAATLFGLLGLAPGPDIGLAAAAALAGLPAAGTRVLLRELEAAHLVAQPVPGRYRMHDLVRLHAAEQARRGLAGSVRAAALGRLVDYFLHTAYAGERLLEPHRPPIEPGVPAGHVRPDPLDDEAGALAWFDAEHHCLLAAHRFAATEGRDEQAWRLAWSLDTFHYRRGHLADNLRVWLDGLGAARRLGTPTALSWAHRRLGHAYARLGRRADGIEHLREAVAATERTGDVANLGNTHRFLALALAQQGEDELARTHATESLRLFGTLDDPVGAANAHNLLGRCHVRLGNHTEARAHCERALALHRGHADRQGEANALDSLGYLAQHAGHYAEAIARYREALAVQQEIDNTYDRAGTLGRLGTALEAVGRHAGARDAWRQAVDLYRAQHREEEAGALAARLAAPPADRAG